MGLFDEPRICVSECERLEAETLYVGHVSVWNVPDSVLAFLHIDAMGMANVEENGRKVRFSVAIVRGKEQTIETVVRSGQGTDPYWTHRIDHHGEDFAYVLFEMTERPRRCKPHAPSYSRCVKNHTNYDPNYNSLAKVGTVPPIP